MADNADTASINTIVTDIEGTTSSIAFVKDVLFPYAARHLPDYVRSHSNEPGVAAALDATAAEAGLERSDEPALIEQLLGWIDQDSKATPLKALQGMIWTAGYERGDYRAHIYPDAASALQRWHRRGLRLYVYSSGSVRAQQLFFRYSEAGDLTPLFSGYFDTTTGPKREAASYRAISAAIQTDPHRTLFLSDIVEELDAARTAGMRTCWLQRPQDLPDPPPRDDHPRAEDFSAVDGLLGEIAER